MSQLWLFDPIQRLLIARSTADLILPPPRIRSWEWIREHIRTKDGLPFNGLDYPWTEGICDAWDDPRRKTIWLQFAARLGKSLISQALLIKSLRTQPAAAMISTSTQDLLQDTIADKLYPMLDKTLTTRSLLPPPHLRSKGKISLRTCVVYGAWAGSASKLADKDPRYKWGFEIDKWSYEKSDEADPLELFLERGMEIPDAKTIIESTPAVEGKSRVNRGLRKGTNCRFLVPCKWCSHYQQLRRGTGQPGEGGLVWDKDAQGHSTPALAFRTARYVCESCRREIGDEDRRPMIRKGKWCPLGCTLDQQGRLHGSPVNDGPDASFQLGRLYAPTFTFADYAKHWIEAQGDREALRNHVNSWDGETWAAVRQSTDWQQLGDRLCRDDLVLGQVPLAARFVTCAVDVQVDHWVYAVLAWGAEATGWLIDYGIAHTWDELAAVIRREYPRGGGSERDRVSFTLIDARDGNRTEEVVAHCRRLNRPDGPWVYPSMGQDAAKMGGRPWYRNEIGTENKLLAARSDRRGLIGFYAIMINTSYWEAWAHNCLFHRAPGEPRSLTLPGQARDDRDLLEQLLNVGAEERETHLGDTERKWVRINRLIPKDFRDAIRYARVAADVYTNGNWARVTPRLPGPAVVSPLPAPAAGNDPPRPAKPPASPPAKTAADPAPAQWVSRPARSRFVRRRIL